MSRRPRTPAPPPDAAAPAAECPQRGLIAALARGELEGDAKRTAEQHLETHAACRQFFRERTAGRFPEFPNFTILEQIGKGGFGVVYKAIHHAKEHVEALKVLFSKTPLLTSYFENEVHLIARLRHPNIALLYDAQLALPPLYYAMEYVDGVRLNEYVKNRPVSLAERIEIVRTVALAIAYAHRQGVIHRDIKPQNVLIDAAGQPHLVDFGIAKRLSQLIGESGEPTASATNEAPVGTVGYIAPEQIKSGAIDARADIFSLGALLFHIVSGEPARLARDAPQRLTALTARQVSRAEDLSEIIARCTAEDPNERYPTCEALAADLDNYLHGRPIAAKRNPSSWYRLKRVAALVVREHALPVRCSLVVLVALLLTLLFHFLGARTAQPLNPGALTRIVGLGPATYDAIRDDEFAELLPELNVYQTKSWRLLYGLFLERVSVARPLAITFDIYFPDCWPEYDEGLLRGIQAVRAPVVLGAIEFNEDAEPMLCPALRTAVHSVGSIKGVTPDYLATEYEVVYAVERGLNPPIPSLSISTFAAARFPDRTPRLMLDAPHQRLELRYERRADSDAGARFLPQADQFPLHQLVRAPADSPRDRGGDLIGHARVAARPKAFWDERTVEMVDVLRAAPEQIRAWFDDRVVLVGQVLPNEDQYRNGLGETIHGVQVHAETIDALLWGARRFRFTRPELAARALFWCGLAGLAASFLAWMPRRHRTVWTLLGVLGALAGPWLVAGAAVRVSDPLRVELWFGFGAFLAAASTVFLARLAAARDFGLAPAPEPAPGDESTLPSTVFAETR